MPSHSLIRWNTQRSEALDEIENAHVMVGGTARGRRYATQQINYSYATLLSSHFQGFCRDLHSESLDQIVALAPPQLQFTLESEFVWNRSIDRGNPHPGAVGSDFGRLGVDFWTEVYSLDARNQRRKELLEELIDWRNAIVHQDFDPVAQGSAISLRLSKVRTWRRAINVLAGQFDLVMYNYLQALTGNVPW